jgi:hypothetical protein
LSKAEYASLPVPSLATIRDWLAPYRELGEVIATTLILIGAGAWLVVHIHDKTVGAWVPVVVAVVLGLAYALDRYRRSRRPPGLADRAINELAVARQYLSHVRDFMEGLRLSAIGLSPDQAIPRLETLRALLFDAIIQGINSDPGEHIRCALFEPRDEDGEQVFRVRASRGHTHRVEHLKLHATSVAGIAYTTKESVYVADAANDPRVEKTVGGRPLNTLYCLPLFTFRADAVEAEGVFSVTSNRTDAFSESDRAFISACSDMVAVVEFFIHIWQEARAQIAEQQLPVAAAPEGLPPGEGPPASPAEPIGDG